MKRVGTITLLLFLLSAPLPLAAGEAEQGELYFLKGYLAHRKHDFRTAVAFLEQAVAARPTEAKFYHQLGRSRLALEDYTEAMAALERALSLDPTFEAARLDLGIAAFKLEDFDRALEAFRAYAAHFPDDPYPLYYEAYIAYLRGDDAHALTLFERVARMNTDFIPIAAYYRGLIHYRRGDLAKAEAAFSKSAATPVESTLVRSSRAFLAEIRKRRASARRYAVGIMVGLEGDSNVILATDETQATPLGIENRGGVRGILRLSGTYRPLWTPRWRARLHADLYQSHHPDLNGGDTIDPGLFDLTAVTLDPSVTFRRRWERWEVRARLTYRFNTALLAFERYQRYHFLLPALEVSPSDRFFTRFYYGFRSLDFSDPTGGQIEIDNRDARTNLLGIDQFLFPHGGTLRLNLGYRLERNDAEGDDFDFQGHEIVVRSEVRLPHQMQLVPKAVFAYRDYLHSGSGTDSSGEARDGGEGAVPSEPRRDKEIRASLRWSKEIHERWQLFATGSFTRNFSLEAFAYTRWIGGIGIGFHY